VARPTACRVNPSRQGDRASSQEAFSVGLLDRTSRLLPLDLLSSSEVMANRMCNLRLLIINFLFTGIAFMAPRSPSTRRTNALSPTATMRGTREIDYSACSPIPLWCSLAGADRFIEQLQMPSVSLLRGPHEPILTQGRRAFSNAPQMIAGAS